MWFWPCPNVSDPLGSLHSVCWEGLGSRQSRLWRPLLVVLWRQASHRYPVSHTHTHPWKLSVCGSKLSWEVGAETSWALLSSMKPE